MNHYGNVTVSLSPEQQVQLLKFCARQQKALNRRLDRLNAQINGTYNEIYAVSDLAASVNSASRDYDEAYSYND